MSGTSGTTAGMTGTTPADGLADRVTMLRALAGSISGRGRVIGPAGGWVRVDFDDIRRHVQPTG